MPQLGIDTVNTITNNDISKIEITIPIYAITPWGVSITNKPFR